MWTGSATSASCQLGSFGEDWDCRGMSPGLHPRAAPACQGTGRRWGYAGRRWQQRWVAGPVRVITMVLLPVEKEQADRDHGPCPHWSSQAALEAGPPAALASSGTKEPLCRVGPTLPRFHPQTPVPYSSPQRSQWGKQGVICSGLYPRRPVCRLLEGTIGWS